MNFFVLFTVFGILFVGELGDKSQLIIFNLVLELEEKPYKIGLGATLGFAIIVSIGVIFGNIFTQFIPVSIISVISGFIFIIIGIVETRHLKSLYYEMKNAKKNADTFYNEESSDGDKKKPLFERFKKNPYLAGFGSIFIMELADKTQILTISLASVYPSPFEVWLGSFLALTSLVWIGVFFGAGIQKYIPKFYIKIIAILIFIGVGIFIIGSNFFPLN
jgi:putative Ca2+/H+ antiporter (TMEM165/GDT1 family)